MYVENKSGQGEDKCDLPLFPSSSPFEGFDYI